MDWIHLLSKVSLFKIHDILYQIVFAWSKVRWLGQLWLVMCHLHILSYPFCSHCISLLLGWMFWASWANEPFHMSSSNNDPYPLALGINTPTLSTHQTLCRSGADQTGLIKVGLLTHPSALPKLIVNHFMGLFYSYWTLPISQYYCASADTMAYQLILLPINRYHCLSVDTIACRPIQLPIGWTIINHICVWQKVGVCLDPESCCSNWDIYKGGRLTS